MAGLSSCATVYKSAQTPDDVYFSPAPPQDEYVTIDNNYRDSYGGTSYEDRQIRRQINDRRLRTLDNYNYGYNYQNYGYSYQPYSNYPFHNNYPYYSYSYSPYSYSAFGFSPYNSYYPYNYSYYPPVYSYPATGKSPILYNTPRRYNLGAYGNNTANSGSQPVFRSGNQNSGTVPVRTFNNSRPANGTGVGNFIRDVFKSPSGNRNYYTPNDNSSQIRTFQPSRSTITNNSSFSNSSSSGSNAPVRSFRR